MVELEICVWHADGYESTRIAGPSESDLADAIGRLDGKARNDLYLRVPNGPWMGFGGGPDRVVVTYADAEEGAFYQAIVSPDDERAAPVMIMVGGQDVLLRPHMLLASSDAVAAAVDFVQSETRPTTLEWSAQ